MMMTNNLKETKIIQKSDNLQLYARASAPSRDYYGLTITQFNLILNIWKISYGPHSTPKQKLCILDEFQDDKSFQEEIKNVFGEGIFDFLFSLSIGERKLENLPWKIFQYLLNFLNLSDILKLMCCSKILYELCNQEEVWKLLFGKKFGRKPSKEENYLAMDSSWKEVFKRRLIYVRKALRESNERKKLKKKLELQGKNTKRNIIVRK